MSPKTGKVLDLKIASPKAPSKTAKRKDAPTTIVSPPSKKGRVQKNGSRVKTPPHPKCQPGRMSLTLPPDRPKMLPANASNTSGREDGGAAVGNKSKMADGSPPSSPDNLMGRQRTPAIVTELAELNLDTPKALGKSTRARTKPSIKSNGGGISSSIGAERGLSSGSSVTPPKKKIIITLSTPSKNTRSKKVASGTGKEEPEKQFGPTPTKIRLVTSSVTAVQEPDLKTPISPPSKNKSRKSFSIPGTSKRPSKTPNTSPNDQKVASKNTSTSDATRSPIIAPTGEELSVTLVSTTKKKLSVKNAAPKTSKVKLKNVNSNASPGKGTSAQEDTPVLSPSKKPGPMKAATGARKSSIKESEKSDLKSGKLPLRSAVDESSIPSTGEPITPSSSFAGAPESAMEVVASKQKLSSNVAEVSGSLVRTPVIPVVYRNGKQVRRIQPVLVTGNTPPPSPKIRPTLPIPQTQSLVKKPESQSEQLSRLFWTKDTPVYRSPYAALPRNQNPVEKPAAGNANALILPTFQPEQEDQDTNSQFSSSQGSGSQLTSFRSTSLPYRRKKLPPTHLPGGLGVRIRDKPLPKGVSKPTAQQILNIITPGVQRRAWGEPARIPNEKALEMIEDIFQAKALDEATVYDILRLPIYRSWEEHRGNYEKLVQCLQEEMAGGGRVVLGVKYIKEAYSEISSPQMKAAYDRALNFENQERGLVVLHSAPRLAGALEGPPHTPSFHDLGDERGSGVQGVVTMFFRVHKPIRMPMQTHNSFWTALAYGLQGDIKYWGSIKAATSKYWNDVFSTFKHPRYVGYMVMKNYGLSMGDPSMENQLTSDFDVTPEMWQVAADTFSIELLTILNIPYSPPPASNKPSSQKPARKTLTVIPRGSHNRRQIFILFSPATKDYEPVFPVTKNDPDWRYSDHMPAQRIQAPTGDAVPKVEKEKSESDMRRCPFLERDERGVFLKPVGKMEGYEGKIEAPRALVG